jgi:hypothetical protein
MVIIVLKAKGIANGQNKYLIGGGEYNEEHIRISDDANLYHDGMSKS